MRPWDFGAKASSHAKRLPEERFRLPASCTKKCDISSDVPRDCSRLWHRYWCGWYDPIRGFNCGLSGTHMLPHLTQHPTIRYINDTPSLRWRLISMSTADITNYRRCNTELYCIASCIGVRTFWLEACLQLRWRCSAWEAYCLRGWGNRGQAM